MTKIPSTTNNLTAESERTRRSRRSTFAHKPNAASDIHPANSSAKGSLWSVLYARYSSDEQNPYSVDRQFDTSRRHAEENSCEVSRVHGAVASRAEEDLNRFISRLQDGKRTAAMNGKLSGHNCFGYHRVLNGSKMKSAVKNDEAVVVRVIFDLFLRGLSPKEIAEVLNARPAEERCHRVWKPDTIASSAKCGSGILRRVCYTGLVVYGRVSVRRNKKTGKYERRVNPRNYWVVGELDPSLIIIPRDEFARAQQLLNARSIASRLKMRRITYSDRHAIEWNDRSRSS